MENKVELTLNEKGFGKVMLNGKELSGVFAATIVAVANQPTKVIFEIYAEVEAITTVNSEYVQYIKR